METQNIEDLIALDLQTFLNLKTKNETISIDDALEIGAFIAANFMRIIYTKNKKIKQVEINGVIGIVSNLFNTYFNDQITDKDFQDMSQKSLQLLQNTDFDQVSKDFFNNIITSSTKQ